MADLLLVDQFGAGGDGTALQFELGHGGELVPAQRQKSIQLAHQCAVERRHAVVILEQRTRYAAKGWVPCPSDDLKLAYCFGLVCWLSISAMLVVSYHGIPATTPSWRLVPEG